MCRGDPDTLIVDLAVNVPGTGVQITEQRIDTDAPILMTERGLLNQQPDDQQIILDENNNQQLDGIGGNANNLLMFKASVSS